MIGQSAWRSGDESYAFWKRLRECAHYHKYRRLRNLHSEDDDVCKWKNEGTKCNDWPSDKDRCPSSSSMKNWYATVRIPLPVSRGNEGVFLMPGPAQAEMATGASAGGHNHKKVSSSNAGRPRPLCTDRAAVIVQRRCRTVDTRMRRMIHLAFARYLPFSVGSRIAGGHSHVNEHFNRHFPGVSRPWWNWIAA